MTDARSRVIALLCLASPVLVIAVLASDARIRRSARRADEPAVALVAARLPTSDLALSGGARWLRAPSLEEPGAAFADGPALPDPDPAGGAMAPPVPVWTAVVERARETGGNGQPAPPKGSR
ncbi:MAG TPA: hypothetical protein VM580_28340 [Labilithrix sp.]|nr:hypothetical protein [Labilithrix sp.]